MDIREYPKWVTPNRAAWLAAQTPDERRAAKVLVADIVEHRAVAPADFAPVAEVPFVAEQVLEQIAEAAEAVPVKRGPGRPRKVVVSEVD